MTTSRGFATNEYYDGMSFHNLDEMQPPKQRFTPIVLRSHNQEYQHQETGNGDRYQTSKSERSNFCSKQCLIGLGIGLAIAVVLVLVTAIPLGVIERCGVGVISSTPNWIGTFLMDNGCDTTQCCCLSNQITLTQPIGNQIQITGSVTGSCSGIPPLLILPISTPIGFQTIFPWGSETIRLQLGQDNSYLAFVNVRHAYCSATALRTSYNAGSMKSMNLGLVMFILPITIGIMK